MEHKEIPGKRGTIHYWIDGQSESCIVFTHGATMDHGLFQFQMEYFAQPHTVNSWDVPLHGRSRLYEGFYPSHLLFFDSIRTARLSIPSPGKSHSMKSLGLMHLKRWAD